MNSGDGDGTDLTEWRDRLNAAMTDADRLFPGNDLQERYMIQQAALIELCGAVRKLPGFQSSMAPLMALVTALDDLILGTNAMPAVKRTGRAPHGFKDHWLQGRSAAVAQWLINNGFREPDACDFVATRLAKQRAKGRRGSAIAAGTVRDWLANVSLTFCDKPDARAVYLGTLEILESRDVSALNKTQLKQVAERFLTPGDHPLRGVLYPEAD